MSWILEGLRVKGEYLGEFLVSGIVKESRVTFGGNVNHTVALDEPITVYGSIRDVVVLKHNELSVVTY